ncbi:MAG: hypothetical protein ABIS03_01540 [Gemmatimonadaceae bacterium]
MPTNNTELLMNIADAGSMESAVRGTPDPDIVALEEQLRSAQLSGDVRALDLAH